MKETERWKTNLFLAFTGGALIGGLSVLIMGEILPRTMSRIMERMMTNMRTEMGEDCSPEDI